MKLFLSYKFANQQFVELVYYILSRQGLELFYWPRHGQAQPLNTELRESIDAADGMIAFLGAEWGGTQEREIEYFLANRNGRPFVAVQLLPQLPKDAQMPLSSWGKTPVEGLDYNGAKELSKKIVHLLGQPWVPEDGLPNRYIVAYEKKFLEELRDNKEERLRELRMECGWTGWPGVIRKEATHENPVRDKSIGILSDGTDGVLLDARASLEGAELKSAITLPEARPRTHLRYPLHEGDVLRVAILVSGGIAPGINALIDGIVSRHTLYSRYQMPTLPHCLEIFGYREGFRALFQPGVNPQRLTPDAVRATVENGGSCLGTSRIDDLLPGREDRDEKLKTAVGKLRGDGINILYVIGGDGSMSCAHALWHYARQMRYELSVVGIPKAMDNDILWVWQSFGFLSAVEEARQAILHMHTEVSSNPRVGIIQLFGSDSGFVASHAGYSTACDLVLIPEDPMSMDQIFDHVSHKLRQRYGNGLTNTCPYAVVVMAETALPSDADRYLTNPRVGLTGDERDGVEAFLRQDRRVRGQTPDELRTAGLKIVSKVLEEKIQKTLTPHDYWSHFRVISNEPRHLIRSIPPSVTDVIFGERLGSLAVDNAMAGYTDFMVSQWLTEFILVPLPLVVLGRKRVSTDGIFWKSVLAKTQQRAAAAPAHIPVNQL